MVRVTPAQRRAIEKSFPTTARRAAMSAGMRRMRIETKTKVPIKAGRGSLQRQIASLTRQVRGIAPEIKYIDISPDLSNVNDAAGAIVHLTAIAAGDDQTNRTSDGIRLKSICLSGIVAPANTFQAAVGVGYRCGLVIDRQQIADTAPTCSDIFTTISPAELFLNLDSLKRFEIIYLSPFFAANRMISWTAAGTFAGASSQSPLVEYNWQGDLEVRYNGTASTDQQKNAVYFFFVSNDDNDTVDFNGNVRLGFIDA